MGLSSMGAGIYVRWSMKHCGRLHGTFWREFDRSPSQHIVIDGCSIPTGTLVGISPYSIMHNEKYFPDPFAFRPERWLSESLGDKEEEKAIIRQAFVPFALGETGCLGKVMAYHEASLTLAKTFWFFDFETTPGEAGCLGGGEPGRTDGRDKKGEYQLYDVATADHDGPNVMFTTNGENWKHLLKGR